MKQLPTTTRKKTYRVAAHRLRGLLRCALLACLPLVALASEEGAEPLLPALTDSQASWLGQQVFANECRSELSCLTSWNPGEDFPSLGIGHFIWYQEQQAEIFEETFPSLLAFLTAKGVRLPAWLQASAHQDANSPWRSREEFYADIDSARMQTLRTLLAATQGEQAEFIILRLERSVVDLLAATPAHERSALRARLRRLAESSPPAGLYAMIDYVHFKGTGLSSHERYRSEGWGLLQVLQGMDDDGEALDSFVRSAHRTLERRVANAPLERDEGRWLAGWKNRLQTYLDARHQSR